MTTSATDSNPQTGVPAGGHYVHRPVRQYCLYCDCPSASDEEWETIPEGEGGHLCWGECRISAEDALERVSRERDSLAARLEQLQRAAVAVMEWYFRDGSVGGAENPMYELMKSCGVTEEWLRRK